MFTPTPSFLFNASLPHLLAFPESRLITSRSVVIAIANSLSNLGAFVSSYVFYSVFGPTYRTSWIMVLGMTLYSAIMVWWLKHMNDKRNVTCVPFQSLLSSPASLTNHASPLCTYVLYVYDADNPRLAEVEERYKNGEISDAELETMEPDAQMAARAGFRLGS